MAELQPASYTAGACHTAQSDRLIWSSIICEEGVSDKEAGDLAVAVGTTGLTVDVASGSAFIQGDTIADQGMYHVTNIGTVTLTLAASDPTDGRRDLVVATVRDAQYSGADNDWILQVITGVPSPAPADPALPPNSIPLGSVLVAAGAATPAGITVTDVRPQMGFCDSLVSSDVTNRALQARSWRSTPAAMANGATTNIPWNSFDYNNGMTTGGTGTAVPLTGRYKINLQVGVNNTAATGTLHIAVTVNGAPVRVISRSGFAPTGPTVAGGLVTMQLNAGDVVSGAVFHNNGGSINIGDLSPTLYQTYLEIDWVHS